MICSNSSNEPIQDLMMKRSAEEYSLLFNDMQEK